MTTAHDAIILFAHGSRDPQWHRPIEAVAQRVRAQSPATTVVCAYLELSPPDLPSAVETLVAQGTMRLRIVPLFLGMGKHAREDLPTITQTLRQRFPQVDIDLQPAVGENTLLLDTLCAIALQASTPNGAVS